MNTASKELNYAFQKVEKFAQDKYDQMPDALDRANRGETDMDEFMNLAHQKNMAYQGMSALIKLDFKSVQKVLDEAK
jgi:benzoyl-CoA reductase/2-hydroxyglutaryl-CoA dehydratase subunit BcrC/BadD/HgdB